MRIPYGQADFQIGLILMQEDILKKIRECLFEGNVQEAEKLAEQSMYATSPNMRVYQPLGDIWIRFMDQEAERKSGSG